MSLSGGDHGDMGDRLSDAEIEALRADSDPALADLLADLREYAGWSPSPHQRTDHVAAAVAAAGVATEGVAHQGDNLSAGPTNRREWMIGRIASTRLAKILAGVLATLLASSGIAWAATGSSPVDQVSTVAQQVGTVFGANSDESESDEPEVEEVESDDLGYVQPEKAVVEESDVQSEDEVEEPEVEDDHSVDVDENESDEVDDSSSDEVEENESDDTEEDDSYENDDESGHHDGGYDDESEHEGEGGHDD